MKEIEQLKKFILSQSSENAKNHLVFPLFQKLFGNKFKRESDAQNADTYIEGKLIVELKSGSQNYIEGFYQALHYSKKGLSFSAICVIAYKFIALWKINKIPDFAKIIAAQSDSQKSASEIGVANAKRTTKAQRTQILRNADFTLLPQDFEGIFEKDYITELTCFVQVLRNLDVERIQVNTHNFIICIEQLKRFFDEPLEAIHFFYAIVGYWTVTSKVSKIGDSDKLILTDNTRGIERSSEPVKFIERNYADLKKFIEDRYIFTNEGSGLKVDYYFSRFDEAITKIDPEYAKQHGIFFTDDNLSKFALWFVHQFYEKKISDKYIVLDPAGGSGNLVTSWRGHLKHKIVSELQPDLLKNIERRMKLDPEEVQQGFTIIPRTSENIGLNFLDKSAEQYLGYLIKELKNKNLTLNKPIAFLLNPPYKNTDENVDIRIKTEAKYEIDSSIIELTGKDAGKERYLGFLGQIINIARIQMGDINATTLNFEDISLPDPLDKELFESPLLLIFTPTSWLIPRPTYVPFRKLFDKYFKFEKGFIILGNEFFKIKGRFPISFTIWRYNYDEDGNVNKIITTDLTRVKADFFKGINWNSKLETINNVLLNLIKESHTVNFSKRRISIKVKLDQFMYDFKRDRTQSELKSKGIIGGLPLKNPKRSNKKTYGIPMGKYLGFMDDNSPVRVKEDRYDRFSNKCDRVWFRLDNSIADVNKTRCLSGPLAVKGYCAFDLDSAYKTFEWFSISKAINGRYPIWANQFDIWNPNDYKGKENEFYSLCFAFGLSENRCVVTRFEKDNPVQDAPDIFIDNPLCPANSESFWSMTLDKEVKMEYSENAYKLVNLIKKLYKDWNLKYCKGQNLYNVGLQDEHYFKYFDYPDFLTPYSGLIQIKKYAENKNISDLLILFKEITNLTKVIKDEIFNMLVEEFKYFE